jgi:Arc/MetJ-type ribon-helix-helix transcriptional regulator
MIAMELTLAPETLRMVEEKLKQGVYRSADELVQAGLLALDGLESPEFDAETQAAIDHAEEQIQQGKVHRWEDVREQVKAMFLPK